MPESLRNLFDHYFEMIGADDDRLREFAYRLRYEVYCRELGLDDPSHCAAGLEHDAEDDRAEIHLIRHKETSIYAATTRLILPDRNDLDRFFPTEAHASIVRKDLLEGIPRQKLGEISRFCIDKRFRRRPGEQGTATGCPQTLAEDSGELGLERRAIPHIILGLYAGLVRSSARNGITHWFALMEPSLCRLFSFFGLRFTVIGPAVAFFGTRHPYIIDVRQMLDDVAAKNFSAYELMTDRGRYWGEIPRWDRDADPLAKRLRRAHA